MRAIAIVERIGACYGVAGGIDHGKMSGVRAFAKADKRLLDCCVICGHAARVRIAGFDDFAGGSALRIDGGGDFLGVAGISEASDGDV